MPTTDTLDSAIAAAAITGLSRPISAVQAALDKVALGLLDDHAHHCVVSGPAAKRDDRTEELMAAVGRLMRRG